MKLFSRVPKRTQSPDHVKRKSPPRRRRALIIPICLLALRSLAAIASMALFRKTYSMRRYFIGGGVTVALCWLISIGYMFLAPAVFTSHWSLILPTSSSSVSLQLESIGHAQTVASSPFGSASLSPKVIYKEIIGSEQVRLAASKSFGMNMPQFGSARIKLIDETALVMLEINGRSADEAQAKAQALNAAFERALDVLRRDEIKRRSDVVKESLTVYQENLQTARQRIIDQQQRTGVLSINQFNEASSSLEQIRRRLNDVRADLEKLSAEQRMLANGLGIEPDAASALLQLAGDPVFAKLASDFAEANAQYRTEGRRLGDANPFFINFKRRSDNLGAQLTAMLGNGATGAILSERLLLVTNGSQSADMMRTLVTNSVQLAGRAAEATSLEGEFRRTSAQVNQMSLDVARLEDLRKDHIVAEAVFTSALARLDTNRADIYASYPMVQMLAAPDLPEHRSNPGKFIIILCALIASMLSIGGWSMAWLRHAFVQRRTKSI